MLRDQARKSQGAEAGSEWVISALATLLLMSCSLASGQAFPAIQRWILFVAFDGPASGVTWPSGWQPLFDVDDTSSKRISCAAAWRNGEEQPKDEDVDPIPHNSVRRVGQLLLAHFPGHITAPEPRAAWAINGMTTDPAPPGLTVPWARGDTVWFSVLCSPRGLVGGEVQVNQASAFTPAPFTVKPTHVDNTITATVAVRVPDGWRLTPTPQP